MEWRILNFSESVIHVSSVFSTLGLDFFSPGPHLGSLRLLVRFLVLCPSCFVQNQKSSQRRQEEKTFIWIWDLDYCLSFQRKALCGVASLDFPHWPNTIEISTTYPWHPVSCFYHLTFSITNKQKCWHVDSCHGLTAWFRSWRASWMPTSHCVQLPLGARLPSDLLLWWPTEALAQWWLAELHFPEWSDTCKTYWAQEYDPLHSV